MSWTTQSVIPASLLLVASQFLSVRSSAAEPRFPSGTFSLEDVELSYSRSLTFSVTADSGYSVTVKGNGEARARFPQSQGGSLDFTVSKSDIEKLLEVAIEGGFFRVEPHYITAYSLRRLDDGRYSISAGHPSDVASTRVKVRLKDVEYSTSFTQLSKDVPDVAIRLANLLHGLGETAHRAALNDRGHR